MRSYRPTGGQRCRRQQHVMGLDELTRISQLKVKSTNLGKKLNKKIKLNKTNYF